MDAGRKVSIGLMATVMMMPVLAVMAAAATTVMGRSQGHGPGAGALLLAEKLSAAQLLGS